MAIFSSFIKHTLHMEILCVVKTKIGKSINHLKLQHVDHHNLYSQLKMSRCCLI